MPQQPISIIGAGIGGVTLGRCLLRRGISSVLYERASPTARHGYGITLYPSAYQPLLKVLNMDESTFKQRIAVDGPVGGFGAIESKQANQHEGASLPFRAHREKLERLLRDGLDIRWENALEKLEEDQTGLILHLQNGQSVKQTCVIGVDGPHANSRKSLLPDISLTVLPFVAFNGQRRINKDTFQALYSPAMQGLTVIETRSNDALLQISVNEDQRDLVSISWVYSRAARGADDPLYRPNRPISGATDIPKEFYQEIGALTNLEQPFQDVFDEEKMQIERVLSWLMRTVQVGLPELRGLAEKGIFFIGDSVHAQPILGGEGANTAIKDGVELAEHIANHGYHTISDWYQEVYQSWDDGVQRSKTAIQKMHS